MNKISESSRHLKSNPMYSFRWKVLMALAINDCVRKSIEASRAFKALSRPSLN